MSPTITFEQWEERKEEILRLYIVEGLALKPVMRAMRAHDFDPSESQYRTKLKKWQRRKPRNHRQRAPRPVQNTSSTIASPLDFVTPGTSQSSTQPGALLVDLFDPLAVGEFPGPYRSPTEWPNRSLGAGAVIEQVTIAPPTFNQELTRTQRQWQDLGPLDLSDEELREQLPDVWHRGYERRRRVAASYNPTSQPRIQRAALTRLPASRQLKIHSPRAVDTTNPTMLQTPPQYPWTAQPITTAPATLAAPRIMPAAEGPWWYLTPMPVASSVAAEADPLQQY
ncbi:MAG: hypothetical protein LQ339_008542 [Xanthoria mediterranea]|nr:MAG: hypothetical protein LQ339_008542 [Xanthoria mediterranea]